RHEISPHTFSSSHSHRLSQRPAQRRPLHSFPTRRSSDLSAATVSAWTATASATDNCGGSATLTPSYTPPPDNCNRTVTVTFTVRDRKSTRLNSSHLGISYAVFCLKKKKQNIVSYLLGNTY